MTWDLKTHLWSNPKHQHHYQYHYHHLHEKTYSINCERDWVSWENLLWGNLVIARSCVNLADLGKSPSTIGNHGGDYGDEDLLEERQDEDEAWSPHEGHVKGWAEDNSSLIFRDLDGGDDFRCRSTLPSTKKLCILTSLPSHLSKHKEERQWGGDDDERVGEDVEDEGGGPPQPRVGWPLHMSN